MPIIESIPNVSEGRRPDVIERMAGRSADTPGVRLLDHSSDASHNRSVFTLAGDAAARQGRDAGALRRRARGHRPAAASRRASTPRRRRRRAVRSDRGVTMAECVALAKDVGAAVAERFSCRCFSTRRRRPIPRARTSRTSAAASSKGWRPRWPPPAGRRTSARPRRTPPPARRSIGARMPLIAYNINLNTDRLDVAKKIASRDPPQQRRAALSSRRWASSSTTATSRRCR